MNFLKAVAQLNNNCTRVGRIVESM